MHLLQQPTIRLLTLLGPGGVGKTRLASAAAEELLREYEDGVYIVELAPVTDPEQVIPTIARTLDVREVPGTPLISTLKGQLADKSMLLVLDNFEQVISASKEVADLLAGCDRLKLLVTSRSPLGLRLERQHAVPPLSLPEAGRLLSPDALSRYGAVELFVERATQADPEFQVTETNMGAVAEICGRVDGLPLAIELVAAHLKLLTPQLILARLTNPLRLLRSSAQDTHDLTGRHRTLRDTIEWSYNLLTDWEQTLFRRLSVFRGGFTLRAAEAVCNNSGEITVEADHPSAIEVLEGLEALVDKSLVRRLEHSEDEEEDRRLGMLEIVREYAWEKLEESGDLDPANGRHCDYFLQVAEDAEQRTLGREAALWLRKLDAEQNNLRAALAWSLSVDGSGGGPWAEKGLRLAGALVRYWDNRGYYSEGREWCTQLLKKAQPAEPSVIRAKALRALARMIYGQGDFAEARVVYEQSLEMSRAVGDDRGVAAALVGLGIAAMWQGEYSFSHARYEESLVIGRRIRDKAIIAQALSMIGIILMREGEYRAAQSSLEEALAIERESGHIAAVPDLLTIQGTVAIHLGEYEKAKALIEEGLGIARGLEDRRNIPFSLARLGMIALRQGEPQRAEAHFLEGLARTHDTGMRRWARWYLVGLAEVSRLGGQVERAARLIGASEGVMSAAGARFEPATSDEISRIVASVRAELDEETFARLWAEGREMTLDELMDLAAQPDVHTPTDPATTPIAATKGQQAYPDALTEREVEVLRLIAAGMSNHEIGEKLVLSRRTVERHISNIYQKIGASGKVARSAATAYAIRKGIAR